MVFPYWPYFVGSRHLIGFLICFISVSHTTRSPVNKEENGEDYFFVTKDEFEHGVMEVIRIPVPRANCTVHLFVFYHWAWVLRSPMN